VAVDRLALAALVVRAERDLSRLVSVAVQTPRAALVETARSNQETAAIVRLRAAPVVLAAVRLYLLALAARIPRDLPVLAARLARL
jgi:hypothetical protein